MLKKRAYLSLLNLFCLVILSCTSNSNTPFDKKNIHQTQGSVKNIILLIGDGMGPQQLGLLEEYARRAPHSVYRGKPTGITRFADQGSTGFSLHGSYDALVVDSACSATQLATGTESRNEMIGADKDGNPAQTILQYAKSLGKSTGLVSDTRITHATPAAFASHQAHRALENEIAAQMIEQNQVDVMLSGGLSYFLPMNISDLSGNLPVNDPAHDRVIQKISASHVPLKSSRKDNQHLLQQAYNQDYQFAFNRTQLNEITQGRLLGLFAYSSMQDGSRQLWQPNPDEPSLKEMTLKALELLEKDPDGFFLMIEGGQIDWAGHSNDAGRLLHELLRFDEAIQAVYEWAQNRDDTLVIITADHETGGFGFSYSRYNIPAPTKLNGSLFKDKLYAPNFNFGDLTILDDLYQQKKSFYDIWQQAKNSAEKSSSDNNLPAAENLMQSINSNTAFSIDIRETQKILLKEKNEYQIDGHNYLNSKDFPKIHDFKEFYVYGDELHLNLMGRALGKYQNVTWGTGTHTHTPVPVIAWGPSQFEFNGIQTHVELGQKMRLLLK